MKKKIAILGSTGSIGKTLINIIKRDKKNFEIVLLSADENYKELLKQASLFNVKNLILTSKNSYKKIQEKKISKKIRIFNNFDIFKKIFKKKIDYTMSSISGIEGLKPTIEMIKYTKNIAIANKESIICGWNLIEKELKKNKTNFIPVDSEHFSIWYALKGIDKKIIERIYLTASGGPFLNYPKKKFNKIKMKQALSHPNWKMGKKISVDSATMMNKAFEIIEAKKIFNISYRKLSIIIHPKSYVHAILKFKNGLTKIIVHDTNMEIPIFNSIYSSKQTINSKKLNLSVLNNLNFQDIDLKRFPIIKILSKLPEKPSLFETVLVSINDKLVKLFLTNRIKFTDISKKMNIMLELNEFKKFKKLRANKVEDIMKLNKKVEFKLNSIINNYK